MALHLGKRSIQGIVIIALLCMLLAAYLVYRPGLNGTFVFDDVPNIVDNADIAIQDLHPQTLRRAAFSSSSGPLLRPVSMLSFATNYYLTELDPFYFKLTNLVIHLISGVGIFVLTTLILSAYRKRFEQGITGGHALVIALAVTAAWLLHPFNLTSVLYVVQRMTSLASMFCVGGLILFTWGRIRLLEGKPGRFAILASLLVFTPLAILSKEIGALLPAFMLVTEVSLFQFQTSQATDRRFLLGFFTISVAVPAVIILAYVATHPSVVMSGYMTRSFTLTERLLTEPRVIWFYLHQIVLPSIAEMGLFHDDIGISHDLLSPATTLIASVGIAALLMLSWLARRRAPIITFGILFFLAGHVLESTVFPLEITHEHRNYLPMFGILLIVFFYLLYPLRFVDNLRMRQGLVVMLLTVFAFDTWSRASDWSNPFQQAEREVEHHPNSARDNLEMGNNFATLTVADAGLSESYFKSAREFYEKTITLDSNYTNGLFGLIVFAARSGKEIEPRWISELQHRLRYAKIESDTGNKLMLLVDCQTKQICKLSQKDMDEILHAGLNNPAVTGTRRAMINSSLSFYLVNVRQDYQTAVKVMYDTIADAPKEMSYRLTLVKFLGALGRAEEARKQLAIIKSMDNLNIYAEQISAQEKLLGSSANHIAN